MLLANHGALTVGNDLYSAYYKMETIEHFAHISLVARMLGRENLISRDEVLRLQQLRGTYGIKAPAPICATDDGPSSNQADCQVVQAPESTGPRLVTNVITPGHDSPSASPPSLAGQPAASYGGRRPGLDGGAGEIRLTYRELSQLIEDAIRALR